MKVIRPTSALEPMNVSPSKAPAITFTYLGLPTLKSKKL